MKKAKTIMVQGTGSGVGKSVIVSALCRLFLKDGFTVAPFKAQNMALNSFVTSEGGEIGRAQATQALACRIKPSIHHNPILIKPASHTCAQVIVSGKPVGTMSVYQYQRFKERAFGKVKESFRRLAAENDIVVIEGAGSPAEVNLRSHDLVNMKVAALASAPVLLVGDIDKGGLFAWFIGTLELLRPEEKKRVKGFIINKFRGDQRLLRPGIKFLENYTGIKVIGVIPYFQDIKIPEEDSLPAESVKRDSLSKKKVRISVVLLPHMSNFDEFDALQKEGDVSLEYARYPKDLAGADAIIIPGTKNTVGDLIYLNRSGMAAKIALLYKSSGRLRLIGICGGYQILGQEILDKNGLESKKKKMRGLGILPLVSELYPGKVLSQVKARHISSAIEVSGYEIHHGRTQAAGGQLPVFLVTEFRNKKTKKEEGSRTPDGRCWGTYIHGLFDNDIFRRDFLNSIRKDKGWIVLDKGISHNPDKEIDKISDLVRRNINLDLLYDIVFKR